MAEFASVEPFGIDAGELYGLTPEMCFTLGVEWQMVASQAEGRFGFERPVHSENLARLKDVLTRRNRTYRFQYMHDDASEGWVWLVVEAL